MNIPLNELYAILDAFKRGYRDAYHRGQYKNSFQGSCSSAYKQGYDFGMTVLAEHDNPEEDAEAHDVE